ncbi:MAG: hypothetical protein HZB10_01230 [Candidatus Yonathbacteria bacterium]|nr:hypothetical protein [Candidatus Yonathbacteria bacterium]
MELNTKKFALAATETGAILYVVCALFVAVAPDLAMTLLGWLAHVTNTDTLARSVTMIGVAYGLIQVVVYVYIAASMFSWFYNRSLKQG